MIQITQDKYYKISLVSFKLLFYLSFKPDTDTTLITTGKQDDYREDVHGFPSEDTMQNCYPKHSLQGAARDHFSRVIVIGDCIFTTIFSET